MNSNNILFIVESPNKVKTLKTFLSSNYTVMASVGHVTKIADSGIYNMGIDVDNNFTPDIIIDPKKKDVVKALKNNIKLADKIILATDGDREGEAISSNLVSILKIPDDKYERITFQEITKSAVTEALKHPRKIDEKMATSALTRSILDKIVGYRISPIVLTKVSAKSAGRVQSAALKVLAMREEEIKNFVPKTFYEIWLPFEKNGITYKCQYKGTDKKLTVSLSSKATAEKVVSECKSGNYIVKKIEDSEKSLKSKPPFTTSTFQQAVSSLLGYTPKKAMECAQRLFEGIELNGSHVALITYIRTDSTVMSEEFVKDLEKFVKTKYGKEYFAPVKQAKKKAHEQDGHEAIRCIDLEMTPEKLSSLITDTQLVKVYKIIYERTVASAMSDCIETVTEYSIYNDKHRFAFNKHKIKFPGFKKVYSYNEEDEKDDEKFPSLQLNEKINDKPLELKEKQTQPPSRYSEAGLVKKLEELGIGRPSTFASICNVLTDPDRGYTEKEGKTLKVTEKGLRLSHFLDQHFGDIINISYTSEMENSLDEIASGKLNNIDFLKSFYTKLNNDASLARKSDSEKAPVETLDRKCPKCGHNLVIRMSKYGKFIACSNYPKCKYTEKIIENGVSSSKENENKNISVGVKCPDCGSDIVIRTNKQGQKFYACSGFPKHKRIFTELEIKKLAEAQNTLLLSKDKE